MGVATVRGFRVDSDGYDQIRSAGFTSTGVLQWSPVGESRFPVDELRAWRDYVGTTVRAYPDVRQWEVWNEPPNFTSDTSPASYAKIVVAAHEVVKAIDPTVQLGLAAKSTHTAWLREAIIAGAAEHYDYVTLHPYERAGGLADGWEEPFLAIVAQVRAMLSEADRTRSGAPVEFTEVGAPAAQRPGVEDARSTPEEQARTLVKVMALSVAQGVRRVSWYDPYDGDYDGGEAAFGLIARDGTPRPSFNAYGTLITTLGARPDFIGIIRPHEDSYPVVFRRDDGTAAAVGWTRGEERSTSFEQPVRATSAVTGEEETTTDVALSLDPVIISLSDETGSETLLQAARQTRAARPRTQTSVAWDAGSGPSGLYVRGLGAPAQQDGRTASAPDGAVVRIAVGPDFDFEASGVELTVVVRGVAGEPGFNLKYDADAPLSTLNPSGQGLADGGWRPVGTGEWRTLRWTLSDLRLAGMYGDNFRLDSDTSGFSGYELASIGLKVLASRRSSSKTT